MALAAYVSVHAVDQRSEVVSKVGVLDHVRGQIDWERLKSRGQEFLTLGGSGLQHEGYRKRTLKSPTKSKSITTDWTWSALYITLHQSIDTSIDEQ